MSKYILMVTPYCHGSMAHWLECLCCTHKHMGSKPDSGQVHELPLYFATVSASVKMSSDQNINGILLLFIIIIHMLFYKF